MGNLIINLLAGITGGLGGFSVGYYLMLRPLLKRYSQAVTERNYYMYGLKHGYTLEQVKKFMLSKDGE